MTDEVIQVNEQQGTSKRRLSLTTSQTEFLATCEELFEAWMSRNLKDFKEILLRENCKIDYIYNKNDYKRILDSAAETGEIPFLEALIEAGVNINDGNQMKNYKAPIHFAVEELQLEVLQVLLQRGADPNLQDSLGQTPLHYLANGFENPEEQIACVELLLAQDKININMANRKGFTPIHWAARKGAREMVEIIIKKGKDLNLDNFALYNQITARHDIEKKYPDLELPTKTPTHQVRVDEKQLFTLLNDGHEERFIEKFTQEVKDKKQEFLLTITDGTNTFLQLACRKQLERVVELLLTCGADVNFAVNNKSPMEITCEKGNLSILKILLRPENSPNFRPNLKGENLLHVLTRSQTKNSDGNYKECLKFLLDNYRGIRILVNSVDNYNNTPLHNAVSSCDEECILLLLNAGASLAPLNNLKQTPLTKMESGTLKKFLDSKITIEEQLSKFDDVQWKIDFNFLLWRKLEKDKNRAIILKEEEPEDYKKPEKEYDPLLSIADSSELFHLLSHPILRTFVLLKWKKLQIFYFSALLFYAWFCAFFTIYILFGYRIITKYAPNMLNESTEEYSRMFSGDYDMVEEVEELGGVLFIRSIVLIFLFLMFVRALWEVSFRLKVFRSIPKIMEVAMIIFSTFVVIKDCSREFKISSGLFIWCPQFSALAILLAWLKLALLVSKHPYFADKVVMFRKISYQFLKLFVWYFILMIAFAVSFSVLFRGCDDDCVEASPFYDPGFSVFKTFIILSENFKSRLPVIGQVILVCFFFFITAVLFSILVGFAVGEVRSAAKNTLLHNTIAYLKLVTTIEDFFLNDHTPLKIKISKLQRCFNCRRKREGGNMYHYFIQRYHFPPPTSRGCLYINPSKGNQIDFDFNFKTNSCWKQNDRIEETTATQIKKILSTKVKEDTILENDVVEEKSTDTLKPEIQECHNRVDNLITTMDDLVTINKQNEQLLINIMAVISLNNADKNSISEDEPVKVKEDISPKERLHSLYNFLKN